MNYDALVAVFDEDEFQLLSKAVKLRDTKAAYKQAVGVFLTEEERQLLKESALKAAKHIKARTGLGLECVLAVIKAFQAKG